MNAMNKINETKRGYIYIIENDINNEIYVGATTKDVAYRFNQHLQESKQPLCFFHEFIKRIGHNHFSYRILKEIRFNNILELLFCEKQFIKDFGTLNSKNNVICPEIFESLPTEEACKENNDYIFEKLPEIFSLVVKDHKYEKLSFENFMLLFFDDCSKDIIKKINSNDAKIVLTNEIIEWIGYGGDHQKYSLLKMLMRHNISFEYYFENERKKKILLNTDDLKKIALLKIGQSKIKNYYRILEKICFLYDKYIAIIVASSPSIKSSV